MQSATSYHSGESSPLASWAQLSGSSYQVELDVFEGPLDLLLHLVRKHELDILDIPISFVTEKYLEYLDYMKSLNLDVAGEYLLMAATLAFIKSRELLPPEESLDEDGFEEEDGVDPRRELIRRLLEYQKYKDAAENLADRPALGRNVWRRGVSQQNAVASECDGDAASPLATFPVHKLIDAFDRLLSKAKVKASHEVNVDRLSLSDAINSLVDRLENETRLVFSSCFAFLQDGLDPREARHRAVVTLLAILEMAKLRMIKVEQALPPSELEEGGEFRDEEIFLEKATADISRVASENLAEDEYR